VWLDEAELEPEEEPAEVVVKNWEAGELEVPVAKLWDTEELEVSAELAKLWEAEMLEVSVELAELETEPWEAEVLGVSVELVELETRLWEVELWEAEVLGASVELDELEAKLWEAEALVNELLELEIDGVTLDDRELDRVLLGVELELDGLAELALELWDVVADVLATEEALELVVDDRLDELAVEDTLLDVLEAVDADKDSKEVDVNEPEEDEMVEDDKVVVEEEVKVDEVIEVEVKEVEVQLKLELELVVTGLIQLKQPKSKPTSPEELGWKLPSSEPSNKEHDSSKPTRSKELQLTVVAQASAHKKLSKVAIRPIWFADVVPCTAHIKSVGSGSSWVQVICAKTALKPRRTMRLHGNERTIFIGFKETRLLGAWESAMSILNRAD
jgi:hypothetical protein